MSDSKKLDHTDFTNNFRDIGRVEGVEDFAGCESTSRSRLHNPGVKLSVTINE